MTTYTRSPETETLSPNPQADPNEPNSRDGGQTEQEQGVLPFAGGPGCLFFWKKKKRQKIADSEKRLHSMRPVSSCTGRIKTLLIADKHPLDYYGEFKLEELYEQYTLFTQEFKEDEVQHVPNIWAFMNYPYSRNSGIGVDSVATGAFDGALTSAMAEGPHLAPPETKKGAAKGVRIGTADEKRRSSRLMAELQLKKLLKTAQLSAALDGLDFRPDTDGADSYHHIRVVRHNFDVPEYIREYLPALKVEGDPSVLGRFAFKGLDWLQDPFCVMRTNDGETVVLDPHYIPEGFRNMGGDLLRPFLTRRFLAREIAAAQKAVLKPTPFIIEGGNILADQDFLVMGADTFLENWKTFQNHPRHNTFGEMYTELRRDFGVEWLIIPGLIDPDLESKKGTHSPIRDLAYREFQELCASKEKPCLLPNQHNILYHLDLFMALGGYNPENGRMTIFIAEAFETKQGKIEAIPPEKYHCFKSGMGLNAYLDLVAQWFTAPPAYLVEYFKEAALRTDVDRNWKDGAPRITGFEVRRIPCLFDADGGDIFYSFVNGQFENYWVRRGSKPVRRVYMPSFVEFPEGSPVRQVQQDAKASFEESGFEVVEMVFGLRELAEKGAGFHCVTKVMQRYPYHSIDLANPSRFRVAWIGVRNLPRRIGRFASNLVRGVIRYVKNDEE